MGFVDVLKVEPKTKVDDFFKVYLPASMRNVIGLERGDKLSVAVDEEGKAIKLIKG